MSAADARFDLLLRDIGWLITVDAQRRIIRDAAIGVKDGRIVAIGKTTEISGDSTEVIDCRGMVATPGFVDAHLHSSFHLSRGLADEANAQSFLLRMRLSGRQPNQPAALRTRFFSTVPTGRFG